MGVGVIVAVGVTVAVGVDVGVEVDVGVDVAVGVCVCVGVGVGVAVGVYVGVKVGVAVWVLVGVGVGIGVAVRVAPGVCVWVGLGSRVKESVGDGPRGVGVVPVSLRNNNRPATTHARQMAKVVKNMANAISESREVVMRFRLKLAADHDPLSAPLGSCPVEAMLNFPATVPGNRERRG